MGRPKGNHVRIGNVVDIRNRPSVKKHKSRKDVIHPNFRAVKAVLSVALSEGLIVLSAGTARLVVRLITPLITTSSDVQLSVDILSRTI
jgi:4-aminobutyrate aminotransferase-like enzyme